MCMCCASAISSTYTNIVIVMLDLFLRDGVFPVLGQDEPHPLCAAELQPLAGARGRGRGEVGLLEAVPQLGQETPQLPGGRGELRHGHPGHSNQSSGK